MALTEKGEDGRPTPAGVAHWWLVDGGLAGAEYPIHGPDAVLDPGGRYLEPRRGHEKAWDACKSPGADAPSDEPPRGTVAFDCLLRKFVVRGPTELVGDASPSCGLLRIFGWRMPLACAVGDRRGSVILADMTPC